MSSTTIFHVTVLCLLLSHLLWYMCALLENTVVYIHAIWICHWFLLYRLLVLKARVIFVVDWAMVCVCVIIALVAILWVAFSWRVEVSWEYCQSVCGGREGGEGGGGEGGREERRQFITTPISHQHTWMILQQTIIMEYAIYYKQLHVLHIVLDTLYTTIPHWQELESSYSSWRGVAVFLFSLALPSLVLEKAGSVHSQYCRSQEVVPSFLSLHSYIHVRGTVGGSITQTFTSTTIGVGCQQPVPLTDQQQLCIAYL